MIDVMSYAVWLAAMVLAAAVLLRRRLDRPHDARPAYAFVIALALLTNPHLFVHDAAIWTVPVVLYAAAMRDAAGEWRRFVRFALLWPLFFAAADLMQVKAGRVAWFDPRIWALIAATAIIGWRWPSADEGQPVSDASAYSFPSGMNITARPGSVV
jgi:hypothetical protein